MPVQATAYRPTNATPPRSAVPALPSASAATAMPANLAATAYTSASPAAAPAAGQVRSMGRVVPTGLDPAEAGKARLSECVRPALVPSKKQTDAIMALVYSANATVGEESNRLLQKALDETLRVYGIAMPANSRVVFDPGVGNGHGAVAEDDGQIRFGKGPIADAIQFGPGALAATLCHEGTHIRQFAEHGTPGNSEKASEPGGNRNGFGIQTSAAYELMCYEDSLRMAKTLSLPAELTQRWAKNAEQYRQVLTPENQEIYKNEGRYWDLTAPQGHEGCLPDQHIH